MKNVLLDGEKDLRVLFFTARFPCFIENEPKNIYPTYNSLAEILKLSDERYDNIHFETIPGSKKQIE